MNQTLRENKWIVLSSLRNKTYKQGLWYKNITTILVVYVMATTLKDSSSLNLIFFQNKQHSSFISKRYMVFMYFLQPNSYNCLCVKQ